MLLTRPRDLQAGRGEQGFTVRPAASRASRAVPPHPGVAPLRAVSPRLSNTWAAFVSAFAACRQATQRNVAWLSRLVGEECPHLAHSTEEFRGSTLTSTPPRMRHL
jgi:hypothetical protein